jgi:hypothetical protein
MADPRLKVKYKEEIIPTLTKENKKKTSAPPGSSHLKRKGLLLRINTPEQVALHGKIIDALADKKIIER